MKIKHFIIAIAIVAGLVSSIQIKAKEAPAPTCPGSGQDCAQTTDGTIYYKGLDQ
jgi:hypothetical protein